MGWHRLLLVFPLLTFISGLLETGVTPRLCEVYHTPVYSSPKQAFKPISS